MRFLACAGAIVCLWTRTASAECKPLTFPMLEEMVQKEGDKHLVFFSSWCSSCKESLTKKLPDNSVLVASFDKPERAQKVLTAFGISRPCYLDNGVTEKLGIKVVPATYDFKKRQ